MSIKYLLILLAALALVLSACSNNQFSYDENSALKAMDNFSQADIIGTMTALKNGLKPNVKPTGSAASEPARNQTGASSGQKQLENLAAQYDEAVIKTNFGGIRVKFYAQESPITVNNFFNLAKAGFYDGTKFHRVIKNFMIQGGDPLSKDDSQVDNWGKGGPGYQFQDEINSHKLVKGSLAMANSGPNTNGSQFFIVTASSTPWLDGKHTNFGYVISGLDAVERIQNVKVNQNDHPVEDAVINKIELVNSKTGESGQAKVQGAELPPATASSTSGTKSASSTSAPGQEERGNYKIEN